MEDNKIKLKELPKDTKFATFNSDNEDIILGEYLIATLIYNGATINQLLESANKIKDKKERKDVKRIMTQMILNYVNINPEYIYFLKDNTGANKL